MNSTLHLEPSGPTASRRYGPIIASFFTIFLVSFLFKGYRNRKKYHNLPGPPHSMFWGHLKAMGEITMSAPNNAHPQGFMTMIQQKYDLGPIFYMDIWPMQDPMVCVCDPTMAAQVTQTKSLKKHPILTDFVTHLTGDTSMLLTDGEEWKKMRTMFNPGFATAHLMTLMDNMVDDTMIFFNRLAGWADRSELFQLEEATTRLTVDIIGRVVLDHKMNAQISEDRFLTLFRKSVVWTAQAYELNPFVIYNPVAYFLKWWFRREMDRYIGDLLDKRYSTNAESTKRGRKKPAIDLALDEFRLQAKEQNKSANISGTDPAFKRAVQDQMKTFVFAGHDTSSSTLCYAYHLLHLHPDKLAKVRDELNRVLGVDIEKGPELLKASPQVINQMPYLQAVIKETLRLYPAASSIRMGDPDTVMTLNGEEYPADNMMTWIVGHSIGRRADLFPSPDEFIPERFLPAPDNFQTVPKDAWRPFEKGPRACIGQELAMLEMKIILALTLRSFDICEAYEEYDRKMGRKDPGSILGGKRGMFGQRAYQQLVASAKPVDSFPARVTRVRS